MSQSGRGAAEPEGWRPAADDSAAHDSAAPDSTAPDSAAHDSAAHDSAAESRHELSVLEEALRRALATAPREAVIKSIAATLPVEVDVAQGARLHGGKVRKVSVSMPEELAEAVRTRTGAGGFSRYVTDGGTGEGPAGSATMTWQLLEAEYGLDETRKEYGRRRTSASARADEAGMARIRGG